MHPFVWRFFSRHLQGKFYKSDTDEVKRVTNLLEKLDYKGVDVKIIRVDILIVLKVGNNLMVSDKLLDVARSDEGLALVLLHELAHEQLGHLANRYIAWSFDFFHRRFLAF